MRPENDGSYQDWKTGTEDGFHLLDLGLSPYDVSEWLYAQEVESGNNFTDTTAMLFIISIAEYEVRHDILEERIRNGAAYHIYRYENMGRYKKDLSPEEREQIEEDMAYIKSHVKLPKLMSYEDRDFN